MIFKIEKKEEFGEQTIEVHLNDISKNVDYEECNDAVRNFYASMIGNDPLFEIFNEYQVSEDEFDKGSIILIIYDFNSINEIDNLIEKLNDITPQFNFSDWVI